MDGCCDGADPPPDGQARESFKMQPCNTTVVGWTPLVLTTLRLAPLVRVPSDSAMPPPAPWNAICETGEAARARATLRTTPPQSCTSAANELSGMAQSVAVKPSV